ncbi:tRNA-2-methylthio-N6-dimethylallyladenosine synthase [Candidatus Gastranaerophilus sp. (ex Termes propinquus)]|nr:tRNA-2-methylthio-N6-dimethylallyladenosine synthase [Candidatus Gastranaerophilus sp. (ex Termes propinquus)]
MSERAEVDKKVYIETLGCQMNKSDTERILGILLHFGWIQVQRAEDASFLIINTCSIRQLSEDKAYSRLGLWGKWKRAGKKDLKIAICGCTAQHYGASLLKRFPYLDLVFGTQNIYELPSLINSPERVCAIRDEATAEGENVEFVRTKTAGAWLPIIEGCNNFCTYCVVPYTRGRERSRAFDSVIKEAKDIVVQGFSEITLLGQNVDSYGKDLKGKPMLSNLLREINKIEGKFRLRFTTSYPSDITDDLICAVAESDKVCPYFHIPMQSGNDDILKAMNRRYTRAQYGEIIKKIRASIPEAVITSDFIVGFPGEVQAQFEDTLSAIDEFDISYSNIAAFSPRPKTVAAKMSDKFIDDTVKDVRFQILNDKIKAVSRAFCKKAVGKTLEVLVDTLKQDGTASGRTWDNKTVHFKCAPDAKVGDFVDILITSASTWHLKGEPKIVAKSL